MLSVEEVLEHYFLNHVVEHVVARERAEYAIGALNGFFEHDISDVDIPLCRAYRKHRHTVKDATVRRELSTLQAAANHCLKWRLLKLEEMPTIELPKGARAKTLWLTLEEMVRLREAAETISLRCHKFVVLAYYTAGRKESVEKLSWAQVDLKRKRIDLQAPDGASTKKRRPIIPIYPEVLERLLQWKDSATTAFVLEDPSDIRYEFDKAAKAAGLEMLEADGLRLSGRLTPHVLRHTRATHLLQANKPPYAVANLLGDNVETVLRVYGHACPDYMADALA